MGTIDKVLGGLVQFMGEAFASSSINWKGKWRSSTLRFEEKEEEGEAILPILLVYPRATRWVGDVSKGVGRRKGD